MTRAGLALLAFVILALAVIGLAVLVAQARVWFLRRLAWKGRR